jgi:O-acetyl-ADP-ribose deacetylase (regulator of RNase III)
MIHYCEGNLLESNAEALVNTVNTVGVMGKGIALQFKNQFPENYKVYRAAWKAGEIGIGKLFVSDAGLRVGGPKLIINFPTKIDWRKPSEYQYIEAGLVALSQLIQERQLQSIALPPLGAGNGGLVWSRVKDLIETHLSGLDCQIYIYQPNYAVQEVLKTERAKLTPARAMLLSVLFDVVRNGEFVSEFTAEKVAYFLQRFGAKEVFKLDFYPKFYGPYSGKIKHVLYHLNGSYISGYSAKDKRPFDELGLMLDAESDVELVLSKPENAANQAIVQATKEFLSGFYSPFGLELLSSVDFIMTENNILSADEVKSHLEGWSGRKKTLFNNPRFIALAVQKAGQIPA